MGALVLLDFGISALTKALHELFVAPVLSSVFFHVALVVFIDFRDLALAFLRQVREVPVSFFNILLDFEVDHFGVVNADRSLKGLGSHDLVDQVHSCRRKLNLGNNLRWVHVRVDVLSSARVLTDLSYRISLVTIVTGPSGRGLVIETGAGDCFLGLFCWSVDLFDVP